MMECCYRSFDISWHGYVDAALVVVPFDGEPAVEGAGEIDGGGVFGLDGG